MLALLALSRFFEQFSLCTNAIHRRLMKFLKTLHYEAENVIEHLRCEVSCFLRNILLYKKQHNASALRVDFGVRPCIVRGSTSTVRAPDLTAAYYVLALPLCCTCAAYLRSSMPVSACTRQPLHG